MSGRRLPVLATALHGWRLLAGDGSILLRIIVLPLGVLVALDLYLAGIWKRQLESLPTANLQYTTSGIIGLITLDMVLALVLGGLIVALWHRARLTGRQTLSILGLLSAWRNIVALTVHWCALILVTIGMTRVLGSPLGQPVTNFLNWILIERAGLISYPAVYRVLMGLILDGGPLFIALYVSGRLGLMLWARPAGGAGALDRAWAAGDGNGWRIAAAIFLAILPVTILESALQPGTAGGLGMTYILFWSDLANLLQLIAAAAVIGAAHQILLGGEAAAEMESTSQTA